MSTAIPHIYPIGIDPADIDFMGHVNNASYLKWVQDAVVLHSIADRPKRSRPVAISRMIVPRARSSSPERDDGRHRSG